VELHVFAAGAKDRQIPLRLAGDSFRAGNCPHGVERVIARMAELADALASKASTLAGVRVRLPVRARHLVLQGQTTMPIKIVSSPLKRLLREKQLLDEQYFRLFEQSEAIRNKIEGLDLAISIIEKGDQQEPEKAKPPLSSIKALLLDLARDAGASGLNANIAVQMAEKKGIKLLRGTAASNLSRLKADKALVHDKNRYRLPEFTRPQLQLAVHSGGKSS
jgi:hypothetical protein